ncbi:hypothetical protein Golomagni_02851 [Golovinomyces magnicellulatus]|nr:hypothetical protein Golomagni_02851 [Golovinomyces magnicellulatus]
MQQSSPVKMFTPTNRMMVVQREHQSAPFITHRLRQLRKIPPELIPLGVVVGIAVGFAGYSLAKKFWVDKTMRLSRQNRRD